MKSRRLLIIEDQETTAKDIRENLPSSRYDVTAVVSSLEEAVQNAEETRPDLVLVNNGLNGNPYGLEAAQELRRRFDIPVVFTTADSDDNALQHAKSAESSGFILTPLKKEELKFAIEVAIYKHKLEGSITETASWLNSILKSIGDAVITTDTNSRVTFMNPVAEELTGCTRKDALGRDLNQVIMVDTKSLKQLESSVIKSLSEEVEESVAGIHKYSLIAKDQTVTTVSTTLSPIKNDEGRIIGAVLVFRKLNEQKIAATLRDNKDAQIRSGADGGIIPISIILASRSCFVKEGIRKIIEIENDVEVVGEASSLPEILSRIKQKNPDILCIDTSLPDLDMLKIQQAIAENNGDTKILLLLHSIDDELIINSIYLGIHGYLKDTSNPDVLLRAIRAINNDEIWAERDMLTKILRRFTGSRDDNLVLSISKLTIREKEIFKLLAQGCSNKQIAKKLSISRNTVRNHVSKIFDKLGVSNRFQIGSDLFSTDLK
jgi:PAS domain S-box-containing protein